MQLEEPKAKPQVQKLAEESIEPAKEKKRMSKEEIEAKFEIFAARKNGGGGDDAGDEEDGQLIKNEEDELEEAERKRDIKTTLIKLYELFGGMRVILQVGAV